MPTAFTNIQYVLFVTYQYFVTSLCMFCLLIANTWCVTCQYLVCYLSVYGLLLTFCHFAVFCLLFVYELLVSTNASTVGVTDVAISTTCACMVKWCASMQVALIAASVTPASPVLILIWSAVMVIL